MPKIKGGGGFGSKVAPAPEQTPGRTTQGPTPGQTRQGTTPGRTTQGPTPGQTRQGTTPGQTRQGTTPGRTTQGQPSTGQSDNWKPPYSNEEEEKLLLKMPSPPIGFPGHMSDEEFIKEVEKLPSPPIGFPGHMSDEEFIKEVEKLPLPPQSDKMSFFIYLKSLPKNLLKQLLIQDYSNYLKFDEILKSPLAIKMLTEDKERLTNIVSIQERYTYIFKYLIIKGSVATKDYLDAITNYKKQQQSKGGKKTSKKKSTTKKKTPIPAATKSKSK